MATTVYAELLGETRHRWKNLPISDRQQILQFKFIRRFTGDAIYFQPGLRHTSFERELYRYLKKTLNVNTVSIKFHTLSDSQEVQFSRKLGDIETFRQIKFGADVAERDDDLLEYFITTKTLEKARSGDTSILIGPKGSGKTAILKYLENEHPQGHCIVITPEVFATSMLAQFVSASDRVWDEEESFVSTWTFTIFIEVFMRIVANPRGLPNRALQQIRGFLKDNTSYKEMDLFTRFVDYLRRIEAVKIGNYEVTLKTRELQKLYALEEIYSLVPDLRQGLKADILILIDELDQGWDNSPHSNRFLASLVKAATKIQYLGLRVRVLVLVRSEIFELVKPELDQLDKLRSSIHVISWNEGQLASLVLKRAAYSLGFHIRDVGSELTGRLFGESVAGMSGFDYMASRTTRRPREVLQFVRRAHEIAIENGDKTISCSAILEAERSFSGWKLDHLCSEYKYIYPGLKGVLLAFRGIGPVLSSDDMREIQSSRIPMCVDLKGVSWVESTSKDLLQVLYDIEFLGVDLPRGKNVANLGLIGEYEFAYESPSINVRTAKSFIIHPVFWCALELRTE